LYALASAASCFVASSAAATIAFDSAASAFVLRRLLHLFQLRLSLVASAAVAAIASASVDRQLSHPPLLLLLRLIQLNLLLYSASPAAFVWLHRFLLLRPLLLPIAFDSAASAFCCCDHFIATAMALAPLHLLVVSSAVAIAFDWLRLPLVVGAVWLLLLLWCIDRCIGFKL
jgi:hypothetical protein